MNENDFCPENTPDDLSFEEMQKIPEINSHISFIESELYMLGSIMGKKEVVGGYTANNGEMISLNFNVLGQMAQYRAIWKKDKDGQYCYSPVFLVKVMDISRDEGNEISLEDIPRLFEKLGL